MTGGTSGIGRAIVAALGAAGARVLVNGPHDATWDLILAQEPEAVAFPADLARAGEVQDLAERVLAHGAPDHLFLNAGITGRLAPVDDGYEAEVDQIFAVNLHHARRLCDLLLPAMSDRRGANVVITASLSAVRGNRALGAYSLTKAALAQLARDMAVRWGRRACASTLYLPV